MKTDTAESLFYQANHQMAQGQWDAAESSFRLALELEPDLAEVHANLAWLLQQQKRHAEAGAAYQRACLLAPDNVQITLNYGVMLAQERRFAEAEQLYRQVLLQHPDSIFALCNLGVLLASTLHEIEAEACYRRALELDPAYRKAAFNLAYLLLRQGHYAEGWRMLEARETPAILDYYLSQQPHSLRWQGQELVGKSIIILFESGHGDTIQFTRYASLLKQAGATCVTCLCHPALKKLFANLDGLDDVFSYEENIPGSGCDYWVPMYSLPGLFHTQIDSIPAELPYLHAHPQDVQHWAARMQGPDEHLRIGLVWQGNPLFENDGYRSIHDLAVFKTLVDVPGVHWFSLQKAEGEGAASGMPLTLTSLGSDIRDFADSAAIIMQLDLLITVDTAVAHLAGALGKPCWLMLPAYQTDWRWLKDRADSPWYPAVMHLFRQKYSGDWSGVMQEIKDELMKLPAISKYSVLS
ncbi:tetratricopeptide repeat protein [Undibacterium sp. Di27W]|uniref:tetratricopeptide repeat protein n=1 Tax=Undibacterium sp. Di27W TaxID=3413036 RepID=UPI003BF03080